MTSYALLFTLAALGVSETAYLIRQKLAQKNPTCVIGRECHQVLNSKYSNLFVVPNAFLGLAFYVAIMFMTAFVVIEIGPIVWWGTVIKFCILLGMIASAMLTYIQWRVIRVWCFWCVMSAVTIFSMGIVILVSDLTILQTAI